MDMLTTLIKRAFWCFFNDDEEDNYSTTPTYPQETMPVIGSSARMHTPSAHAGSFRISASHPANRSMSSYSSSVHPTMMLSGACNNRATSMTAGDPSWKMTLPRTFVTLPQVKGMGGCPSQMRGGGIPSSWRRMNVRAVSFGADSIPSEPSYADSKLCGFM